MTSNTDLLVDFLNESEMTQDEAEHAIALVYGNPGCSCGFADLGAPGHEDHDEESEDAAPLLVIRGEDGKDYPLPGQGVDELLPVSEEKGRIAKALAIMNEGLYGDPEVPFRMRAALEGREYR